MIKVHTSDGKTHKIDMLDKEQAQEFLKKFKTRNFQKTITGISVVGNVSNRLKCPCCQKAGYLTCQQCNFDVPIDAKSSSGVQYSLTRPDGFQGQTFFIVENVPTDIENGIRGGERVTCFAGESRLQMMVHAGQPSMRMTTSHVGRFIHSPFFE